MARYLYSHNIFYCLIYAMPIFSFVILIHMQLHLFISVVYLLNHNKDKSVVTVKAIANF